MSIAITKNPCGEVIAPIMSQSRIIAPSIRHKSPIKAIGMATTTHAGMWFLTHHFLNLEDRFFNR
jgi:hypothetical protein